MALSCSFYFSSAVATSLLSRSRSLFFCSISFLSSSTDFFLFSYKSVTIYKSTFNFSFFLSFASFSYLALIVLSSNFSYFLAFNLISFSNLVISANIASNFINFSYFLFDSLLKEESSLYDYFLSES